MLDGQYLERIAEALPGAQETFTRIRDLGFNPLHRRWEYVSLDTRIPVPLMYELSIDECLLDDSTVVLHLPASLCPGGVVEHRE